MSRNPSALVSALVYFEMDKNLERAAALDLPGPLAELPAALRPHRNLFRYYTLTALLAGPGFPFLLVYLYFRFHTMRYEVDAEGITMRWGILFRREVSLTYARIQDIHLTSNVIERWLGLAKIQVQTASGSSTAEMTIEGLAYYQEMRDFLYTRMRGARAGSSTVAAAMDTDDLTATFREIAAELRAIRTVMLQRRDPSPILPPARDGFNEGTPNV